MTKKHTPEWVSRLKEMDSSPLGYVRLNCDGYIVSFQNALSKRRLVTLWFIDGSWKGEYSNPDNPIGVKFGQAFCVRNSPNTLRIIRYLDGAKAAKNAKKQVHIVGYRNYWNSSTALINHLKKTCKEIKIAD